MPPSSAVRSALQKRLGPWARGLGAALCLAAVLLSSGLHTVALQGYAWLRMYDAYSQTLPASTALKLTFAGDELCGICVISQDTLRDVSDSLELSLNEQKPLASVTFETAWQYPAAPSSRQHGPRPLPSLKEITLSVDPPPPRAA